MRLKLNGRAFCLRLHSREARAQGETNDRLDMVAVWREAACFGPAERAALAWCESVTLLPGSGAPEELFEELRHHFTDEQIVALTLAVVAINGWNRLNVAFRMPVSDAARVAHPQAA